MKHTTLTYSEGWDMLWLPSLGTQNLHFSLFDNFTATKLFYLSMKVKVNSRSQFTLP